MFRNCYKEPLCQIAFLNPIASTLSKSHVQCSTLMHKTVCRIPHPLVFWCTHYHIVCNCALPYVVRDAVSRILYGAHRNNLYHRTFSSLTLRQMAFYIVHSLSASLSDGNSFSESVKRVYTNKELETSVRGYLET